MGFQHLVLKYSDLLFLCRIHLIILLRTEGSPLESVCTFLVINYNSGDNLAGCLIGPLQQSGPAELEMENRDSKENGIEP